MHDILSLIHELNIPVAVFKEDGTYLDVNKGFAKVVGYSVKELKESKEGVRLLLDDEMCLVFEDYLKKVFSDPFYAQGFQVKSSCYTSKGGDDIYVKIHGKTIHKNDEAYHIELIDIDEASLVRDNDFIQRQKLESLGRLAGGVAHEINNMLQPILLFSEIIRQKVEGEEEDVNYALDMIRESTLRARDIVEDILVFTRNDKPNTEALSLADSVLQSIVFLRGVLPKGVEIDVSGIESFVVDRGEQKDLVYSDKNAITQILLNLINNSIYAMDDSGLISVDLGREEIGKDLARGLGVSTGAYFKLRLSDTGKGMLPEVASSVFDPFYTTKPVGRGTGLGLSVVYGLVKGWGGAIFVDSVLGQGTTFSIYFPVATDVVVN